MLWRVLAVTDTSASSATIVTFPRPQNVANSVTKQRAKRLPSRTCGRHYSLAAYMDMRRTRRAELAEPNSQSRTRIEVEVRELRVRYLKRCARGVHRP